MDRAVLITGGSRGIGFRTAEAFLKEGDRVSICSKDKEGLGKAREELSKEGEVFAMQADVRSYEEVEQWVEASFKEFGRIDVLVNNAGVAWSGQFIDEEKKSMDRTVDVNVKGVLYGARAVLPYMLREENGIIINISSGAGKSGIPGIATYSATKFAVVGFTEALAGEVGGRGVRVYAVCPGAVATDMQKDVSGRKVGISPKRVAEKIVSLTGKNPPVSPGECLTVYF